MTDMTTTRSQASWAPNGREARPLSEGSRVEALVLPSINAILDEGSAPRMFRPFFIHASSLQ